MQFSTELVTSEQALEEHERRKDRRDSKDKGCEVRPGLLAGRVERRWELDPSPLFLCDLGLIPDVAISLPAQGNRHTLPMTKITRDTLVIPRYTVIVLLYLSSTYLALTQGLVMCQEIYTASQLILRVTI